MKGDLISVQESVPQMEEDVAEDQVDDWNAGLLMGFKWSQFLYLFWSDFYNVLTSGATTFLLRLLFQNGSRRPSFHWQGHDCFHTSAPLAVHYLLLSRSLPAWIAEQVSRFTPGPWGSGGVGPQGLWSYWRVTLTSLNGLDPCKCTILLMAVITADGQSRRERWREGGREAVRKEGSREASRDFMAAFCFTGAED